MLRPWVALCLLLVTAASHAHRSPSRQAIIDALVETSSSSHVRSSHFGASRLSPDGTSPSADKMPDEPMSATSVDDTRPLSQVQALDMPKPTLTPDNLDNPKAIAMVLNGDDPNAEMAESDVPDTSGTPMRIRSSASTGDTEPQPPRKPRDTKSGTTEVVLTDNANVIKDKEPNGEVRAATKAEKAVKKQQAEDMRLQREETNKQSTLAADEMKFKKTEDQQVDENKAKFNAKFKAEIDAKNTKRKENWQKKSAKKKDNDEEASKATKAAIEALQGGELSTKQTLKQQERKIKADLRQTEITEAQREDEDEERHQKSLQAERDKYEKEMEKETDAFDKKIKEEQDKAKEEIEKKQAAMAEEVKQQRNEAKEKAAASLKAEKEKTEAEETKKKQEDEEAAKAEKEATRQQEEAASKKAAEEAEKQAWNVKGMCAFAAQDTGGCPSGWTDYNWAGSITNDPNNRHLNPFTHGAQFNSGWWWSHPRLCCATQDYPELNGKIYMLGQDNCLDKRGLFGVIKTADDYNQSPFVNGGDFNGAWRWTHPFMCRITGDKATLYQHRQQNKRLCMLSANSSCKGKFASDRGWIGVIVPKDAQPPMNIGGGFNPWWKWAHPRLCCSF